MWKNCGEKSWNSSFSHIYIEREARNHPKTKEIVEKLSEAYVIEIENYQDVFHPVGQEFFYQKQSPKLILALKRENFLYPGAKVCENFKQKHFYYTSSVLNCLYDCEYCYLQGVYSSANIVIFVNIEDFMGAVEKELQEKKEIYLCISYDTDLLALEGLTSLVQQWYDFAFKHKGLTIELRTKSAKVLDFSKKRYNPNFILAWTLSEQEITTSIEKKTPPLSQRLKAIQKWQEQGFWIRLCFDPLLVDKHFEEKQRKFLEECFHTIDIEQILDVSIGTFRVSKEYLKKMRKQNKEALSLAYPFVCEEGVYGYPKELRKEMLSFVKAELLKYLPEEKIYLGGEI